MTQNFGFGLVDFTKITKFSGFCTLKSLEFSLPEPQHSFNTAPIFVEIFLRLVGVERVDAGVALAFSLNQLNFHVLKVFFVVVLGAQMKRKSKG